MGNTFFRLIRTPNLVTSAADVFAAALIVMSGVLVRDYTGFALLALASCLLYAGGVVMNDVVDAAVDTVERPERPIPAGRVSKGMAAFLSFCLLVCGLFIAGMVNRLAFQIANLLILTIVLYNGWAKLYHLPGSITMGICRALNFCLGLSLFPKAFFGYVLLSIIPFAHIAAVTSLSRGETTSLSKKYVFLTALVPILLSIALLLGAGGSLYFLETMIFVLIYLIVEMGNLIPAILNPYALNIRRSVKYGILGLVLLDAAMAALFCGWFGAVAVAMLVVLSWLMARSVAMT